MKITTLIENHPSTNQPVLEAEHGVSFFIENLGHVIMSDVGQTGNFATNAVKLGCDLARVEALAISHYHYDHGGGLRQFFQKNQEAKVYLRQVLSDVDYVAISASQPDRYIGLDKGLLAQHEDRIVKVDQNWAIFPWFHLLVDIPWEYPKPSGDQRLMMKKGDQILPDTFEHEMVMVLEGAQGLVVLTGCAHNGVLNMVAATQKAFPGKPILAVIGGFHLHHEGDERIREIGKTLLSWEIPHVVTGHCTGDAAMDILAEVLGETLRPLHSGLILEF